MKTIIVPIDFSACSTNAANYAIELVKNLKAKIIFIHAFQIPAPMPEAYIYPISSKELKEDYTKRLKELVESELALINNDAVDFNYEVNEGNTAHAIIAAAKKYNAKMIIMGTEGASGIIKKYILGSNAADVIAQSTCPVLVIPKGAKYFGLNKIVFTADFKALKSNATFEALMEIVIQHNSEVLIYYIRKMDSELPTLNEAIEGLNIFKIFEHYKHSFHTSAADDIVSTIDEFITTNKADLLVTIPHKRNYFELLFNQSVSRNLVFQTKMPILCLPEQD
jgi:nucleotide-binding universal stress UspA family protein